MRKAVLTSCLLVDLYELALETRPDFRNYKCSNAYQQIWGTMEKAVNNVEKTRCAGEQARKKVTTAWGRETKSFVSHQMQLQHSALQEKKQSLVFLRVSNNQNGVRFLQFKTA